MLCVVVAEIRSLYDVIYLDDATMGRCECECVCVCVSVSVSVSVSTYECVRYCVFVRCSEILCTVKTMLMLLVVRII